MPDISMIYLCGGVGKRAGTGVPKQLRQLNGIPMLLYGLIAVDRIEDIREIIVNYPAGYKELIQSAIAAYGLSTPMKFVPAGETRQDSVRLMLAECSFDSVLIHEAARPLASESEFRRLISSRNTNVSLVCEVPFSVAIVDPHTDRIVQKLNRDTLRNIQLPQKFSRAALTAAHEVAKRQGVGHTEDATVCLDAGETIHFIPGPTANIKITHPEDFALAEILIRGVVSGE